MAKYYEVRGINRRGELVYYLTASEKAVKIDYSDKDFLVFQDDYGCVIRVIRRDFIDVIDVAEVDD